ncbi:hypothetical protein PENTCL1PPCAC_25438, partial [Pristionchus entomophagus]
CPPVVDGRDKCIEVGGGKGGSIPIVLSQIGFRCTSPSNPTIFILPGNQKERFMPARFFICIAGGKWMINP